MVTGDLDGPGTNPVLSALEGLENAGKLSNYLTPNLSSSVDYPCAFPGPTEVSVRRPAPVRASGLDPTSLRRTSRGPGSGARTREWLRSTAGAPRVGGPAAGVAPLGRVRLHPLRLRVLPSEQVDRPLPRPVALFEPVELLEVQEEGRGARAAQGPEEERDADVRPARRASSTAAPGPRVPEPLTPARGGGPRNPCPALQPSPKV